MNAPRAHVRVEHSRNSHNHRDATLREHRVSPDMLTTRDVADLFRTTESTVRYWRHVGAGPEGHRYGRKVLYSRRDVDDWMRTRQQLDVVARRRNGHR